MTAIIIIIVSTVVVALLATLVYEVRDLTRETREVRQSVYALGRVLHSDLADIFSKGIPGRTIRREARK